jgi:hypothetical protein
MGGRRIAGTLFVVVAVLAGLTAAYLKLSPHPGWPLLYSTDCSNESAAIASLRILAEAQAEFQSLAKADLDGDGRGEAGSFAELSGAVPVRGRIDVGTLEPSLLSGAFRRTNEWGFVSRTGYFFVLLLPGKEGDWIFADLADYADIDTDRAEKRWCAYAWPVNYGNSGSRTFFVDETGRITAAEDEDYSGLSPPMPTAAFRAGHGRDADLVPAWEESGSDGNVWTRIGP